MTISSGGASRSCPERISVTCGRVSSAILSSVRFARTSCTTLTTTFVRITQVETMASSQRPSSARANPNPKSVMLMKVKRFSRRICQ